MPLLAYLRNADTAAPPPWSTGEIEDGTRFTPAAVARFVVDVIPDDIVPTDDGRALMRDGRVIGVSSLDQVIAHGIAALAGAAYAAIARDEARNADTADAHAADDDAARADAVAFAAAVHQSMPDADTAAALRSAIAAHAPSAARVASLDIDDHDDLDVIHDEARRDARAARVRASELRRDGSSWFDGVADWIEASERQFGCRPVYAARVRRCVLLYLADARGRTPEERAAALADAVSPGWRSRADLVALTGLRGDALVDVVSRLSPSMSDRIASGASPWSKRQGAYGTVIAPPSHD